MFRFMSVPRAKLTKMVAVLAPRALILKPCRQQWINKSLFRFLSVPGNWAILAPRALILTPWAPTVVVKRLVQVYEHSTCKLN